VKVEPNDIGPGWPQKRRITVGTARVLDPKGKILAWLTTAPRPRGCRQAFSGLDRRDEHARHRAERDRYLSELATSGILEVGRSTIGPDGRPLLMTVAESTGGAMRLHGTANLLHIVGGE
jgi:hypothetical protein